MTALRKKRLRITTIVAVLGLVGIIAVPVSVVFATNALLHSKDGNNIDNSQVMKIPSTPGALLAVTNDAGVVTSLNVIALTPGGVGGTVLSMPVGASTYVATGEAPRRVGDAYATGGLAGLRTEVEAFLDVSLSVAIEMKATDLAVLLQPVAPVNITLTRPVTNSVNNKSTVVAPAGKSNLTADQMAQLLTATQPTQPESARFERAKALWTAIATKVGDGITPQGKLALLDVDGAPADFNGFFQRAIAGPLQVWQFGSVLITEPAQNPQALDLYRVEAGEIITVVASVMPSIASTVSTGLTFAIDSPFSDPKVVRDAVAIVTFWGGSVVLVREVPGPTKVATVALYSDKIIKRDIEGFQPVFGPIELKQSEDGKVEGVDVRLTLGQNFLDFLSNSEQFTTTTTTPQ